MDGERWREVKELFNAAIARNGDDRTSLLASRCNGDDHLRREVERLLAAHDRAGEFIETPAFADAPEFTADNADALVGQHLGRYRIESVLGVGGMGVVYLARDELLDRKVGLKLLPRSVVADGTQLERLKREARTASALNHPNIVTIHEIGQVDGTHYIATEFIDGITLRERMAQGRIPADEALEIALQIAGALCVAHEAGIVHRDIKPENIMLRRDGYVKVLDFGIAQFTPTDATDQSALAKLPLLTQRGVILGTTRYMSPEQARGQPTDARSDVWSLGVVLYEMLTGAPPFDGTTATDVVAAVLLKEPASLEQQGVTAPRALRDVVAQALQKDPARRFQTAKELLSALRAVKESTLPPLSRMLSPVARRRTAALAAAAALALVIAAVVYFGRSPARELDSVAVLPFQNANGGPDAEYLVDGLTEGVMDNLAVVPGIRVTARATAFSFKGRSVAPKELGAKLDVDCFVSGRVERQADKLSVHAELVRTSDGSRMWAAQYDRDVGDLATLQSQIGADIAAKLQRSADRGDRRVGQSRPVDPAAYRDYLKGRFYQEKRTQQDLRESVSWFNQAIEKDPTYAQAYAGLAESYVLFADYDIVPPRDAFPKALAAARSALQFDDTLADAHLVVAAVRLNFDWNLPAAEEAFRHALRFNPNHSAGYNRFGKNYLLIARRFDEAIAAMERAFELDPLSPIISSNLGETYAAAGRFEQGVEQLRKTMLMHPGFAHAYFDLGFAYLSRGEFGEALKQFEAGQRISPDSPASAILIGAAQAFSGDRAAAAATLEKINESCARSYCPNYMLAILHTSLGNKDEAFRLLNRSFDERAVEMLRLEHDPLLSSLRSDARFAELRSKVADAMRGSPPIRAAEKSIAVLPFANLSSDGENAFFADGVHEQILTQLATIADLKVISRTSVMQYKPGEARSLREVGDQLGVAHVLEGSVQRAENRVRVTVQLIDARTDAHLWAQTYDRDAADVFAIQSEVAKAIAGQLQAKLTGREQAVLAARPTDNPEAYDAYLRGLAHTRNRARASVLAAQKHLREAVRIDPKFAHAWALLSVTNSRAFVTQTVDPSPALREEAQHAAETALSLQPNLGEAILAKGNFQYGCLRDYDGAVRYFEQARQLLPNNSRILESLAYVARRRGEWERSEEYFSEAERLDPRNAFLLTQHALSYRALRQFGEAQRKLDQALDVTPNDPGILGYKANIAQAEGDLARAAELLGRVHAPGDMIWLTAYVYQTLLERRSASAITLLKGRLASTERAPAFTTGQLWVHLARAQLAAGDHAGAEESWRRARDELEPLLVEQPDDITVLHYLALAYAGLGDKAAAFAIAERGVAANPIEKDALGGPFSLEILARVAAQTGEPDRAITALEKVVSLPGHSFGAPLTPALLRLDPMFDPLRGDPRFEKLVTETAPQAP